MNWKKRGKASSVREVVESNTGLSADEFLNPQRDPYVAGLDDAVKLVRSCLDKGMPAKVVGDYDCDGIMASAIMQVALREATGKDPAVRLPRRFSEGYGLSMKIIDETDPGTLIITVDNGIAAIDQIRAAKEKDMTVVVIDHHLPVVDENGNAVYPDADIIVDPAAVEGSEFTSYCGAGLAYRFAKKFIPDSKFLTPLLVYASIATVADVVPLKGDNRNIVSDGLKEIRKRNVMLGLHILLNELNLLYVDEGDYGFRLGPIMNAAGRLCDDGPEDVVKFLTAHASQGDPSFPALLYQLREMAKTLIERNEKRKLMVQAAMQQAYESLCKQEIVRPIVIYLPDVSEGIIGIIAGQLAEEFRSPCLVFTDSKDKEILKGSGRTFGDVHLKKMLDYAADCFVGYGGHAGAAGMSIRKSDFHKLRKVLKEYIEKERIDLDKDKDVMWYDLDIRPEDTEASISELTKFAPYGEGNPRPMFRISNFESVPIYGKFFRTLGNSNQHIKVFGKNVSAIGFQMYEKYLTEGEPKVLDIIGNLSSNFFNGKFYPRIEMLDFKEAAKKEKSKEYNDLASLLDFTK